MPILDGTGPRGEGAKTGRGLGKCNDLKINKFNINDISRGLGKKQVNFRKQTNIQNIKRGNR